MHERQAVVFGVLIAALALVGVGAAGIITGAISSPISKPISTRSVTDDAMTTATPCLAKGTKPVQYAKVTVNVYNGGEVRGLAGDVASKLAKKGFQVNNPSNTSQAVTTTVIVGANVNNPEVKLVLSMFKKAKARADGRSDRSVDVLVGSKYGGFNDKAKNWIAVSTSTVCLPSTAPTASASEKS